MGSWAFAFSGLERVVLPRSVARVGSHAFAWCERLRAVQAGPELEGLGAFAFGGTGLCLGPDGAPAGVELRGTWDGDE